MGEKQAGLTSGIELLGSKKPVSNFISKVPWGQIGEAADSLGGFLPQKTEYDGNKGAITAGMDSTYDQISNSLMSIPGWGMFAGGLMKGNKFLGKGVNALGGGTDGMTTTDAILGSSFLNMTPLGMVNGFFGSKTDTMNKDYNTQATMGSSYNGLYSNIDKAMQSQGKKYGAFSQGAKQDANLAIHEAGRTQNILGTLANTVNTNQKLLNNQLDLLNNQNIYNLQGGYNQFAMRAARNGIKLFSNEQLDTINRIKNSKQEKSSNYTFNLNAFNETPSMKQGGEFKFNTSAFTVDKFKQGGSMSIIPEGALHARKHEIFEDAPQLKGQITEKGIPVVIEKEGGEVEQQAEIELNEIIFRTEITKKLEALYKKYENSETSQKEKDELAIQAGKIIAAEIIENTDDRTGLLATV